MPAVSKAQQRFMAMCEHDPAHANGKCPQMTQEQFHEYASTPSKGLPARSLKKRMTKPYGKT